jgi:hypothetical protein
VADAKAVVTTYIYDGTSKRVASIAQTGGGSLTIGYTLVGADYRVTSYSQTIASGVLSATTLSYDIVNRITTISATNRRCCSLLSSSLCPLRSALACSRPMLCVREVYEELAGLRQEEMRRSATGQVSTSIA